METVQASDLHFLENYFPQGIAEGEAFLGREEEMSHLKQNILTGHHTLLLGHRRYGKTSLVKRVLKTLGLPYGEANFYIAQTERSVELKLVELIQLITNQVLGHKPESLMIKAATYFAKKKKKWSFGIKGLIGVEFLPESEGDIPDNILVALDFLEGLLAELNTKAVLFLDEIQEIIRIENGFALQGAIRECAQKSRHIVFIFSGSNRGLLGKMFDDRSMPLYELCERLTLSRISQEAYTAYINQIAIKTKEGPLDSSTMQKIFELSGLHPKRVYNLCYQLWLEYPDCSITSEQVEDTWDRWVRSKLDMIRGQLKRLSSGAIKVLMMIVEHQIVSLTGRLAQNKVGMSGPSILHAVRSLEQEDIVCREREDYQIVDPVIRTALLKYERLN